MKALTVRQPWAWAIVRGGKNVENRSQVTHFRGQLLIHAGQALAGADAFEMVRDFAHPAVMPMLGGPGSPTEVACGALIGAVRVVGCHPADSCAGRCSIWAFDRGHHIRLEDARVFSHPIPAPGRLGIWTVDDPDVLVLVRQELAS